PDLAITHHYIYGASILLGNGDGTFREAGNAPTADQARRIAVGDLNGDGKLDVAMTTEKMPDGTVTVFLGNGDGTLGSKAVFTVSGDITDVEIGDLNGD